MVRKIKKKKITICLSENELRLIKRFAYFHGYSKHTYIMSIIENKYYECEKIDFYNCVNTISYNKSIKRDKSLTLHLNEYEMYLIHALNRFGLSVIEVLVDYLYKEEYIISQERYRNRNKRLNVLFTEKEKELIHEVTEKQDLTITDLF